MASLVEARMNRKQFLTAATRLGAGCLLTRSRVSANVSFDGKNRFALLSDTHIASNAGDSYRGFVPSTNLKAVVQQVLDQPFEMAMLNGDAARLEGLEGDYAQLLKILEPLRSHCPMAIGLGNHDDRDQFRKAFAVELTEAQKAAQRHVVVIESNHATWVVLDSLMYVNKTAGHLGKSQRNWLRGFLQSETTKSGKPILILVHHTLGDNDGELMDAASLLSMAREFPLVKAIFYGHSHKYEIKQEDRLHLINLPAIGYNFDDSQPVGWMEATLEATGMKLRLNAIAGNQEKNGEIVEFAWQ